MPQVRRIEVPFWLTMNGVRVSRFMVPVDLKITDNTIAELEERYSEGDHPENHPRKCESCSLTPDLGTRAN